MKMCMNWKVAVGLAAVGVGILVVAPRLSVAALPLLFMAACPLSMLFMMGGKKKGMSAQGGSCSVEPQPRDERRPASMAGEPAERVEALRSELVEVQARQDAIARTLAELERPTPRAVREAEAIAEEARAGRGSGTT